MAINDAWRDVHAFAINHRCASRDLQAGTDRGNLAIGYEQVAILDDALRTRSPNGGALDQDGVRLLWWRDSSVGASRIGLRKIERFIQRRGFFVRRFRGEGRRSFGAPAYHCAARSFAAARDRFARDSA